MVRKDLQISCGRACALEFPIFSVHFDVYIFWSNKFQFQNYIVLIRLVSQLSSVG